MQAAIPKPYLVDYSMTLCLVSPCSNLGWAQIEVGRVKEQRRASLLASAASEDTLKKEEEELVRLLAHKYVYHPPHPPSAPFERCCNGMNLQR